MNEFIFPPHANLQLLIGLHVSLMAVLIGGTLALIRRGHRSPGAFESAILWLTPVASILIWMFLNVCLDSEPEPAWHRTVSVAELVASLAFVMTRWMLMVPKSGRFGVSNFLLVGGLLVLIGGAAVIPELRAVREEARLTSCRCRMCAITMATHHRLESSPDNRTNPQHLAENGTPRSWRIEYLPMYERGILRAEYHDDLPWDHPDNALLRTQRPSTYQCDTWVRDNVSPNGTRLTAFAMVTGEHAFGTRRGRRFDEIPDGLSNTLCYVEAAGRRIPWMAPLDVELEDQAISVNQPGDRPGYSKSMLSSYHPDVANVLMVDGRSMPINKNIDPKVLRALLTADGHEPISNDVFSNR